MRIKTDEEIKELLQENSKRQAESEEIMGVWKDCNDEMWTNMSDEGERKG